ncbi:hypothetical protein LCGC14_0348400 [marine sediment metagenome]|uniref:Uncharacterized protein n=1 Tax=marine sediment metagenome TaxID=412755 RepID=A0A0F9TUK5_9ZZZZ|nr:hypothetical protein [Maribacter sp.]HDZ04954.1 hypothetical protein [Maribacter sp.]HEC39206.1 hypothetical protein [bacterium]
MRKLIVVLFIISLLIPKQTSAQDSGAVIAGTVGALAAIGAGIAAVEQMKERAELTATEWLLANNPDITSFSLKTIDFDGKKLKDMSSASVITFKIQEFTPSDKPELNGRKQVLLGFTSHGWINEYGIDFNKIKWFLIDEAEWTNMMVSYVKVASGENDNTMVKSTIENGRIVNKGVRLKNKMTIPFYQLSGDMYVVTDYSNEMKFIYNEKSLGIFLKETRDLVQIKRGSLIELHEFFFEE